MMILSALALSAALQQAPAPAPARQAPARPAPARARVVAPPQPQGHTPYDTTVAALTDIGTAVAEVRSAYELYRRAAFNEPNGTVVERAGLYQSRCRDLAASVRRGEQRICRSCLPRSAQPAIDQYRIYLPALRRWADECVTRMTRLKGHGDEATAAARMKGDVLGEADRLVTGLRTYEARLRDVRRVMGWDQQPATPTPRRGN